MDDLKSSRCKACDALFATVWIPERGTHEELCWKCITAAFTEGLDDDLGGEDNFGQIREAYNEYAASKDTLDDN